MKYLVTGAAGFVGANLSVLLKNSDHEVLGIDNYSSYYSPEFKQLRVANLLQPRSIQVLRIDLSELEPFQLIVKKFRPDAIIHLAAQPGVRTPLGESYRYIRDNVVAFSNVLQTAIEESIPQFLYASSSSVYGNSSNVPYREDDQSVRPISIYGATKLSNEILAPAFINGSSTRARGLRFFTVYGPWGRPDMAYFRMIASVLNGTEFKRFGGGEVKRDFTFIDDITQAIKNLSEELISRPEGYSDIVNIGGGKPHSINDLISVISSKLDASLLVAETSSNPNDTNYTNADVTLLNQLTGKIPQMDLERGLESTISWARQPEIQSKLSTWINSTV
jgi:UDP-glucuronate 4-epimerase